MTTRKQRNGNRPQKLTNKNKTDLESIKKEAYRTNATPEDMQDNLTTPVKTNANGRSGKNLKLMKTDPPNHKKGKNYIKFQMDYNHHQASQALLTQKIIELEKSTKEINIKSQNWKN